MIVSGNYFITENEFTALRVTKKGSASDENKVSMINSGSPRTKIYKQPLAYGILKMPFPSHFNIYIIFLLQIMNIAILQVSFLVERMNSFLAQSFTLSSRKM